MLSNLIYGIAYTVWNVGSVGLGYAVKQVGDLFADLGS